MTRSDTPSQPSRRSSRTAIVTGASRGLGLALSRALAARGWWLVLDARAATDLDAAARELARHTVVRSIPGDVADPIQKTGALMAHLAPRLLRRGKKLARVDQIADRTAAGQRSKR